MSDLPSLTFSSFRIPCACTSDTALLTVRTICSSHLPSSWICLPFAFKLTTCSAFECLRMHRPQTSLDVHTSGHGLRTKTTTTKGLMLSSYVHSAQSTLKCNCAPQQSQVYSAKTTMGRTNLGATKTVCCYGQQTPVARDIQPGTARHRLKKKKKDRQKLVR